MYDYTNTASRVTFAHAHAVEIPCITWSRRDQEAVPSPDSASFRGNTTQCVTALGLPCLMTRNLSISLGVLRSNVHEGLDVRCLNLDSSR